MRQFIVIGHDAVATPEFSLDALPSEGGRLDVLCRCVTAAFCLSHGIRESVRVHLILQDQYTVHFDGETLQRLNPDERSTAARIRGALKQRENAVGKIAAETSPGVSISRKDFETVLSEMARENTVVHLQEDGIPVTELDSSDDPVFVLSDHREFTETETALLSNHSDHRIRLGPKALHADHAVTIAHNYLDTHGYRSY